jgi:predicted dehydrogenase
MYPGLSPFVRVHAPLGPDLIDYLSRITRYNTRPQEATDWPLDVHAGPDFLDRMRREPPGGVAVFSGRNSGKIERIIAALETGLHVLADKPAIIEPADLPRLETALSLAQERGLVLADMMTGRHNTLVRLLQALRSDREVFGDPVPGTRDEPGVLLGGVHYLCKVVAGFPNPRPAWYFDITQQGEGLADTGVHLVDRVHDAFSRSAARLPARY